MENKTLPIGSVVKAGNGKGLVVSGILREKEGKIKKYYLIVPYPAGFTGRDSLYQIEADRAELIFEGYRGMFSRAYLDYMDGMERAAGMTDAETFKKELKRAEKILSEWKGGEA